VSAAPADAAAVTSGDRRAGACRSPFRARLALLALLGATYGACAPRLEPADLVLLGGKLVTVDPERPEAEALAARGGRIVAVGTDPDVRPLIGDGTRVIELAGKLAIPGFIECHGHFAGIGRERMRLDVSRARTWDEVVALAVDAARAARPGEWIVGWGWHQEKWDSTPHPAVEGYPTHEALSRLTPDNPVLLKHAAGTHGGLVNARAMAEIGIDATTPDPPGGRIVRDGAGRPTGVLRDGAFRLADEAYGASQARRAPAEIEADAQREIELAAAECRSNGITTFHDAGAELETIPRLRAAAESGRLGVRLWVMLHERVSVEELERLAPQLRTVGAADDHFTLRAIKREVDGALGTHSAWLLEPYTDRPESAGLNTTPLDELERAAEFAAANGFQLATHAIGDRANREMLDLYARVLARHPELRDPRWRIEHAQHLSRADVPRFAELGVIASMQGIHCTSDGPWVPTRLGPQRSREGSYAWRALLDSGAMLCNGTDTPIEPIDPIANFHAAVTRRMGDGTAFHPEQRMTRSEALRSATIDAAYAGFEEEIKGSLSPGKLADVVVLSRDILTVPEEEIRGTEILYTIVGGRVVHERRPA